MNETIPTEERHPLPVVEFAFKRPPYWTPSFKLLFGLLVGGAVVFYASAFDAPVKLGVEAIVPLVACLLALLGRLLLRPRVVPPLVLHEDHVLAPPTGSARRQERLALRDIIAIDLRGQGATERLYIGTTARVFAYARAEFTAPTALETLLKELYMRILRQPEGGRVVEQIARRRKMAVMAMSNTAGATSALLAVICLMFGLMYVGGAFAWPIGLVRFGANVPALVREGEMYRLLAAGFLHAGVLHLYFNGLALFFLGSILERLLGRARFLLIYFISGLGATLASTLWTEQVFSVGASGAIFGLLGGFAVINWRFRRDLPLGFRQPLRWWVVILGLNAALPLLVPQIDFVAHLVGLVCGAFVTFLVVDTQAALDPTAAARPGHRFLALVLSVVNALALFTALGGALRGDGSAEERVAELVARDPQTSPDLLNELAWHYVEDRQAGTSELALAREAAERAVKEAPQGWHIVDTLAAVYYRQGKFDEAVAVQRRALENVAEDYYAEHLAQFLAKRRERQGPLLAGVGANAVALETQGGGARLRVGTDLPRGLLVYALALRDDEVVGLLRIAESNVPAGERVLAFPAPANSRYVIAFVKSPCEECGALAEPTRFWRLENKRNDVP